MRISWEVKFIFLSPVLTSDRYGTDRQSSPYGREFVFGLFPNGALTTKLGTFRFLIQSQVNTTFNITRPAQSWEESYVVPAVPGSLKKNIAGKEQIIRATGVHQHGTFRIVSPPGHDISMVVFGANGEVGKLLETRFLWFWLGTSWLRVRNCNGGMLVEGVRCPR